MSKLTKSRLRSIDALRGIAAVLVVLYHVFGGSTIFRDQLAIGTLNAVNWLYFLPAFGYSGVNLFFVISGFCIHLRWAKARAMGSQTESKIDFVSFWKRRWIRLYPAYIAAILTFLIWEYTQGKLVFGNFFLWDIISHLLLIHNLDNRTVYSLNGVFWTLAIEEQLYLLYFLLLALREKFGWALALGVTFASRFGWLIVSLFVTKIVDYELPFNESAFANWWIWALGALAVENFYRVIELPKWCYSLSLGGLLILIACLIHYFGYAMPTNRPFELAAFMFEPFVWGGGFFMIINNLTRRDLASFGSRITFLLIAACSFVGLFSYSLYLTHELVLRVFDGMNRFLISVICLIIAYVFFLIFELPFMTYLAKEKVVSTFEK